MKSHKSTCMNILYVFLLVLILAAIIVPGVVKHDQESLCKRVGYSDRMEWNGDVYCIGVVDGEIRVLLYSTALELVGKVKE